MQKEMANVRSFVFYLAWCSAPDEESFKRVQFAGPDKAIAAFRGAVRHLWWNDVQRLCWGHRISFTLNANGASLFKSSNTSSWTIQLIVTEIPAAERMKRLVLAVLWFGREKPHMEMFQEAFVEDMKKLSTCGFLWTAKVHYKFSVPFALVVQSIPLQGHQCRGWPNSIDFKTVTGASRSVKGWEELTSTPWSSTAQRGQRSRWLWTWRLQ